MRFRFGRRSGLRLVGRLGGTVRLLGGRGLHLFRARCRFSHRLRRRGIGPRWKLLELEEIGDRHGAGPAFGLGIDVGQLGLGEDLLRLEEAQEGDLAAGVERLGEGHRFPGLGKDVFLVPIDEPLRCPVGGHGLGGLRGEIELHHSQVGPRGGDLGAGGADVALIAVEEGDRHHHLREPLILGGDADLPLVATHQVDVRDRLDDGPLEGPLVAGDPRLGGPRHGIAADNRLLELLEVEVRQFLEQVGLESLDVDSRQADRGGEFAAAGLDEHRRVEDPHLGPVALDAPKEDVGLRALARLGKLTADLVGAFRDVEEELVDLDAALGDEKLVIALAYPTEHVEAGPDQFVFGPLDVADCGLLLEPELAGGNEVLGDRAAPLALRPGHLWAESGDHRIGIEAGLHRLAARCLDGGAGGEHPRMAPLRQSDELLERPRGGNEALHRQGVDEAVVGRHRQRHLRRGELHRGARWPRPVGLVGCGQWEAAGEGENEGGTGSESKSWRHGGIRVRDRGESVRRRHIRKIRHSLPDRFRKPHRNAPPVWDRSFGGVGVH